jgi:hypothetical protein
MDKETRRGKAGTSRAKVESAGSGPGRAIDRERCVKKGSREMQSGRRENFACPPISAILLSLIACTRRYSGCNHEFDQLETDGTYILVILFGNVALAHAFARRESRRQAGERTRIVVAGDSAGITCHKRRQGSKYICRYQTSKRLESAHEARYSKLI